MAYPCLKQPNANSTEQNFQFCDPTMDDTFSFIHQLETGVGRIKLLKNSVCLGTVTRMALTVHYSSNGTFSSYWLLCHIKLQ